MDKVSTLTILTIFSFSCVITIPVRIILHQNSNQNIQNTKGISNPEPQVSNNVKNLLVGLLKDPGILKRGGGCIPLNLGLSHNCDYEAALGESCS